MKKVPDKTSLEALLNMIKQVGPLTYFQTTFLLHWYIINKNKDFGFTTVVGLKDQLTAAIEFLKRIEKEWQSKYVKGGTDLGFFPYFEINAMKEQIEIPKNFAIKIKEAVDTNRELV